MEDYKKRFLESGVLDGIKTQEELSELLNGLHTAALEAMLHGEMEAHLGYPKNAKNGSTNARNGTSGKKLKSAYGESRLNVPRDREGSFEPVVVPKGQSMASPIEKIVISLYAKGMSVSDIE